MDTLLIILSFVMVTIGLLGIVLPILPSITIAWLGLLLFAYATEFSVITLKAVIIFLILTVLVMALDIAAPLLGAKKYRASKYGTLGAFGGTILGLLFLGPIGIIVGPLAGAFLGEFFSGRNSKEALQSAKGTLIGFLASSLIKLVLVLVMLGFLIAALF